MIWVGGHLGRLVSPLVDGQLPLALAERAWRHVLGCPTCRTAVERETWVKDQLSAMSPPPAPADLTGGLCSLPFSGQLDERDRVASAWATVGELERRHRVRRAGATAAGVGAFSVALLGLATMADLGRPVEPPATTTSLSGSTEPSPTARPVGAGMGRDGVSQPGPVSRGWLAAIP